MVASSHRRKAEFSASTEHGTRYVGRTPAVLGPAKFQTKVQHLDAKRSEARRQSGPAFRCAGAATTRCGRTAVPCIRRGRSARRITAVTPGSRSRIRSRRWAQSQWDTPP